MISVRTPCHGAFPSFASPYHERETQKRKWSLPISNDLFTIITPTVNTLSRYCTWFPSEGTVWWTIHWASTTPILSWAGYINQNLIRREYYLIVSFGSENVKFLRKSGWCWPQRIFGGRSPVPIHAPSHSTNFRFSYSKYISQVK